MMNWETDISKAARETMDELGRFGPLDSPKKREIKGWTPDFEDGGLIKTYLTSDDLREMARHFVEVANWLDKRASQ